jgi:DNA-binding CsgD family transcriptional regulator
MTNTIFYKGFSVDPEAGQILGAKGQPIGAVSSRGYLTVNARNRGIQTSLAHRLIWEAVHGPIPNGLVINHKNGRKTDNRIGNLEVVTQSENILHAFRTGLSCVRGERAPSHKLRNAQVIEIRRLATTGLSNQVIADRFGVSRRNVSMIVNRVTWTHI